MSQDTLNPSQIHEAFCLMKDFGTKEKFLTKLLKVFEEKPDQMNGLVCSNLIKSTVEFLVADGVTSAGRVTALKCLVKMAEKFPDWFRQKELTIIDDYCTLVLSLKEEKEKVLEAIGKKYSERIEQLPRNKIARAQAYLKQLLL